MLEKCYGIKCTSRNLNITALAAMSHQLNTFEFLNY